MRRLRTIQVPPYAFPWSCIVPPPAAPASIGRCPPGHQTRASYRPLDSDGPLLGAGLLEVAPRGRALTQPLGVAPHSAAPHQVSFMRDTWSY